ncbi:dTDP-4-amino-4,6-dideoxygalactose transaminase [Sphingobium wenxiniae]|uniref:dTDP-4-amino-4,6-dideoxygalactose transaminase n=1 Tax=Sphingobium wenxiniae (strain DSM 21828 / CGMCC 1.7748 / JZ-1) TaxID=595605 RepID=A0A562K202_SPHWJ|nr:MULTISPECIES: DegT/DnrJ/EryC1/StrS family aminotransferase [Sphingobium]MBB6193631.1 dTDP-4-amino-4,6-dideoxygalactose transaminase [Sphingobium wenxiniae]TWH89438.1 dTDP-4-amino-4,6-dideoxygalactose transaminase [Sphingobium wenxiniae]WRD75403.1 DegT/DnrJ/EryC1/StrS family aminotransferase [Sphingobium baderi]
MTGSATQVAPLARRIAMPPDDDEPIRSRWPFHGEDEIAAVAEILRSGRVNALVHGDHRQRFEQRFADYVGAPHAMAVANGTLALELAFRALGIGTGDEVIVSPRSYFASASAIVAVGAKPVFADIDPISQNIDPDSIADRVTSRTRAILCVHLAGWPCDMGPVQALCNRHGLKLIEDCAQALGAAWHGRMAGSFGDAAAFSFCTDKIMSTGGEGGMLVLRDPAVWERAWSYKDHGKSRAALAAAAATADGCFRWLHEGFGSNYRLTEMQAAIGAIQLAKLPGWLAARQGNAAILDEALGDIPALRLARPPAHIRHAYYKYYCFLRPDPSDNGAARDAFVRDLQKRGVPCGTGSCPEIYRERAFADSDSRPVRPLPMARLVGNSSIMLPVDPSLNAADMRRIADRIRSCAMRREG